jgi:hypothetical protein
MCRRLLVLPVAGALQRQRLQSVMVMTEKLGGSMFARMMVENRFLGFNSGDWLMLLGGLTLAVLLVAVIV